MKSLTEDLTHQMLLSTEEIAQLNDKLIHKTVKKGAVLQSKGDSGTRLYFVKKGCLRSYTIDEKGKEHIFMFAPEGWLISDIESQISETPAELYIDAIEDSELEVLDRNFFDNAQEYQIQMTNAGRNKLFKRISVLQKRVIMLMSASASERYTDFLQTYPNIVQRVPQRMIASYLGITPEALSKIRGDMAKLK
jgi:CRP-like cAMP-binding protein